MALASDGGSFSYQQAEERSVFCSALNKSTKLGLSLENSTANDAKRWHKLKQEKPLGHINILDTVMYLSNKQTNKLKYHRLNKQERESHWLSVGLQSFSTTQRNRHWHVEGQLEIMFMSSAAQLSSSKQCLSDLIDFCRCTQSKLTFM